MELWGFGDTFGGYFALLRGLGKCFLQCWVLHMYICQWEAEELWLYNAWHDRPVDVDESEAVPHVLLHLAAVVLLAIVGSAQSDVLPVLPSPGDGGPVWDNQDNHHISSQRISLLWSSCGVTVEGDGPALSGQSVSTARLVDDVGRDWKWNQVKLHFSLLTSSIAPYHYSIIGRARGRRKCLNAHCRVFNFVHTGHVIMSLSNWCVSSQSDLVNS